MYACVAPVSGALSSQTWTSYPLELELGAVVSCQWVLGPKIIWPAEAVSALNC